MTSDSHDEAFFALSRSLQRRIDKAFHTYSTNRNGVSEPSTNHQRKKRKLNDADDSIVGENGGGGFLIDDQPIPKTFAGGGGFIVDDADAQASSSTAYGGGGGFLVDDTDTQAGFTRDPETQPMSDVEQDDSKLRISMSDIPAALQMLDLPPDDEQVLNVFRNAASGWDDGTASDKESGLVSRDDWRAVCAILFEQHDEDHRSDFEVETEGEGAGGGFIPITRFTSRDSGMDIDYAESSEAHISDDVDSEDEYQEGPSPSKSSSGRRRRATIKPRTRGRRRAVSDSDASVSDDEGTSKPMTSRQKTTCLEAFALFFPAVNADDLPKQKIMIKDIQRVANLLKEKIKADEMLEMLEVFSSSADKSVSLQDFERMMMAARLA